MTTTPTIRSGRYSGRMRRQDFWMRIIPLNILFNIVDWGISAFYNRRIDALADLLPTSEDPTAEQALEYMGRLYENLLPMMGLLLLSMLLYVFITSPWQVRRLHDIGMSGAWYLVWFLPTLFQILLMPVHPFLPEGFQYLPYFVTVPASIFLLVCNIIDSQWAANRYGESPKYAPFKKKPSVPEA